MRLGLALLLLGLTPLFAQNSAQFAGLQQDLAELRNEVEKLKLDNADLREALAKAKAVQAPASGHAEALAKVRAEILAEVDRRLKQQGLDVNAALAEQARQVNAALAGKPAAPVATRPASTAPTTVSDKPAAPAPDDGFPPDMPRTGIKVRVKSGDSVSKLARVHGSKSEWILVANKLASPAALRADVDIFIPQPETPSR
jgi:regulator of replication initiation timing